VRKYKIRVNGREYEVEVEPVGAAEIPSAVPVSEPVSKEPAPATPAAPAPSPVKNNNGGLSGSVKIQAPMPGTVIKVNVKPGEQVKKGQVLCILEAMKMENEISAPQDGEIVSVNVSAGTGVESGSLLISMN